MWVLFLSGPGPSSLSCSASLAPSGPMQGEGKGKKSSYLVATGGSSSGLAVVNHQSVALAGS